MKVFGLIFALISFLKVGNALWAQTDKTFFHEYSVESDEVFSFSPDGCCSYNFTFYHESIPRIINFQSRKPSGWFQYFEWNPHNNLSPRPALIYLGGSGLNAASDGEFLMPAALSSGAVLFSLGDRGVYQTVHEERGPDNTTWYRFGRTIYDGVVIKEQEGTRLISTITKDLSEFVDHVAGLPYIDPRRIVLVGVSEGAYVSLSLSAKSSILAATVAIVPPLLSFRDSLKHQSLIQNSEMHRFFDINSDGFVSQCEYDDRLTHFELSRFSSQNRFALLKSAIRFKNEITLDQMNGVLDEFLAMRPRDQDKEYRKAFAYFGLETQPLSRAELAEASTYLSEIKRLPDGADLAVKTKTALYIFSADSDELVPRKGFDRLRQKLTQSPNPLVHLKLFEGSHDLIFSPGAANPSMAMKGSVGGSYYFSESGIEILRMINDIVSEL